MEDNDAYKFALTKSFTDPDIFFDEINDHREEFNRSMGYLRLIFKQFLEASNGDIYNLHVLMSLFSGSSLRDVAKVNKRSHEFARLILLNIEKSHPLLYKVIKEQNYKVPCITPQFSNKKYRIYDREYKIYTEYKSLKEISKKYDIEYKYLTTFKKVKYFKRRYKVYKMTKEERLILNRGE